MACNNVQLKYLLEFLLLQDILLPSLPKLSVSHDKQFQIHLHKHNTIRGFTNLNSTAELQLPIHAPVAMHCLYLVLWCLKDQDLSLV